MLERVYVDNYRCFVNFECRFSAKQLLLGPNGGGKTSLFQVLATLRDFCVHGVPPDNIFLGSTKTRWQNVPEQTFELDVSGNGGLYTFRLVVDSWGQPARPRVVTEEVLFSGKPVFRFAQGQVHLFNDKHEEKVKYPFDWFRSALATISEPPENTKLTWFRRWLGSLLFIMPDPHRMAAAGSLAEREEAAPAASLGNFAAWYRHLRLESDDQALLRDLREAIPGFQSMDLKEAGFGNRYLLLTFSVDASGTRQPTYPQFFYEISEGQRILVGLYTVLHFALRSGACVLFDEPDNFIALKEIQPWLDKVLERVEDDEAQVLIISHHPELINRLALPGGIVLDRPGGRHTRVTPFTDPAQTGLSPAELVARGWEHE
jgi:predicted ATPase